MNKKKEHECNKCEVIAKLATKKFLQQKKDEIVKFIMYLLSGILGPFIISSIVFIFWNIEKAKQISQEYTWFLEWFYFWCYGVFFLMIIVGAILILWSIYNIFKDWISSNIEKAIKDAKEELKGGK